MPCSIEGRRQHQTPSLQHSSHWWLFSNWHALPKRLLVLFRIILLDPGLYILIIFLSADKVTDRPTPFVAIGGLLPALWYKKYIRVIVPLKVVSDPLLASRVEAGRAPAIDTQNSDSPQVRVSSYPSFRVRLWHIMAPLRLTIEDGNFLDAHGRQITLRGINVAGDAKYPSNPDQPSHVPEKFFNGDNVNFHSRPFSQQDAHIHFSRLKRWGYNTIRYVFTWEAIESAGPGIYDEEWIQHTIEILRLAKEYGFYIFMDPHQDVVSTLSS